MPDISFNQPVPKTPGKFISLDQDGDSIVIRIAGTPFFEALHWVETDGKKERIPCDKLNDPKGETLCPVCESGDRPKLRFYYPVLNRELKMAQIFKTSVSVHTAIKGEFEDGIDVFKFDYKVTRKGGEDPSKYYRVTRLPDSTPLDEKDEEELAKAKAFNIAEETGSPRKSSMEKPPVPEEDGSE